MPTASESKLLLTLICVAQFMVVLDISIVNVSLPAIRDGLGFSTADLQWVVSAYTLTFAGFLLLGGRASDLLGRRRGFIAGTSLFAASSSVCALAQSAATLVAARAVQGVGGAVTSAAVLAILTSSFGEGPSRNRALAAWSAMAGLGGTCGVLIGGVLTQVFGWPAIFVVNVPIGVAAVAAGRRLIPDGPAVDRNRHFDFTGALLVTGGMVGLAFGIVRSETLGWGSPGVLGSVAGGVALLAAFTLFEGRLARDPLIPLWIFHLPMLRAANLILLLLYGPFLALWFLLSLYMHTALGFSAIQTGLAFVPPSIGLALAALFAPRFVARVGPRAVLATVLLIGACGLLLLTRVSADGTYLSDVAPGAVLAAIGLGAALVPGTIAAMQGVPAEYNGIASGLTSTARLLGGALGLAVLTTLATSRADAEISSGAGSAAALVDGYQLAFAVGAAIALLAALLAAVLLRQLPVPARALPRREDPAGSTTPADTDAPAPALPEGLRPRLR